MAIAMTTTDDRLKKLEINSRKNIRQIGELKTNVEKILKNTNFRNGGFEAMWEGAVEQIARKIKSSPKKSAAIVAAVIAAFNSPHIITTLAALFF